MDFTEQILKLALEIPFQIALIYLVLKLEDKRMETMKIREASNQKIIDSLLGLIDEITARNEPEQITRKQLKLFQEHLDRQDKS